MRRLLGRIAVGIALLTLMAGFVAIPLEQEAEAAEPADAVGLLADFSIPMCTLIDDLDDILGEFDNQIGPFDSPRMNRKLIKARAATVDAIADVTNGDLVRAFKDLRKVQRLLEEAVAAGIADMASGTGFAEDIATLTDFRAQTFVDDLIISAESMGSVNASQAARARTRWDDGVAFGNVGTEQWLDAMAKFLAATRVIENNTTIGAPSC